MFRFRLQPVLEYRKVLEENARQDFAVKLRELEVEKKVLAAITGDRAVLARRFMDLANGQGEMKAEDLATLTSRLELLRIKQREQEKVVMQKEEQKEAGRRAMLEAMRNKRVMELLRDRHYGRYQSELKRRETGMLDEFGVRSYNRREAR